MALAAALGTGYAISKKLGFDPFKAVGGFLGGGKEAGYGRAKPGTLPFYIDKLKGVNDNEAIKMAQQLVAMRQSGASDGEIKRFLEDNSGENVLGPEEYNPIFQSLDKAIQQINSAQSQASIQTGTTSGGFMSGSGFGGQTLLIIGVAIAMVWVLIDLVKQ